MKRARPTVVASWLLCLAAGFGVSFALRPGDIGKSLETEAVKTGTPTTSLVPSHSRKLHLEALWSQRRATFNAAEAKPRVLAAIAADKWDEASKKEMVSLLIADPSFINAIWNQADSDNRNAVMAKVIKAVIEDNPSTALSLLDEGKFDFSKIPGIGDMMEQTMYGRSAVDTLDAAKRNRHKLGDEQFHWMILGCSYRSETGRMILEDAALGGSYSKRILNEACMAVLRSDGALPPGTENLEIAKEAITRKAAQDQTTAWLKEGKPLTAEALKGMDDAGVFNALFKSIWNGGKNPDASQLELLAAAGRNEEQQRALELMIEGGRANDALRLLDEIKDMPATKPKRDELITAVATSIYEAGGDVGEACRLMEGIADDPVYWKSMTEVLTKWVTDDPVAGRTYLEQVNDPELRRNLEEALNKASLNP